MRDPQASIFKNRGFRDKERLRTTAVNEVDHDDLCSLLQPLPHYSPGLGVTRKLYLTGALHMSLRARPSERRELPGTDDRQLHRTVQRAVAVSSGQICPVSKPYSKEITVFLHRIELFESYRVAYFSGSSQRF